MTARPIRPISQLSFSINSPISESSFYRFVRRPPRQPLLAKCANAFGEIGRAKKLLTEPLSRFARLLPGKSACFRDETEPCAYGLRARGGDFGRDLAGTRIEFRCGREAMRQAHPRSLRRVDDAARESELNRPALAYRRHHRAK